MKRLVEFEVAGSPGETVVVEVDEAESEVGEERAARPGEVERAGRSLEEALERVKPAATAVIEKLRGLAEPPDDMTITFGIKLTGKAGAVVASAAVEANYQVTLHWRRSGV